MLSSNNFFLNIIQKELNDKNVIYDRNDAVISWSENNSDQKNVAKRIKENHVFIQIDNTIYLNVGYLGNIFISTKNNIDNLHNRIKTYRTSFPIFKLIVCEDDKPNLTMFKLLHNLPSYIDGGNNEVCFKNIPLSNIIDYLLSINIDNIYSLFKSMDTEFLHSSTLFFNQLMDAYNFDVCFIDILHPKVINITIRHNIVKTIPKSEHEIIEQHRVYKLIHNESENKVDLSLQKYNRFHSQGCYKTSYYLHANPYKEYSSICKKLQEIEKLFS